MTPVECKECELGFPLVWHVQSRKMMHLRQGLSVTSCKIIDERDKTKGRT